MTDQQPRTTRRSVLRASAGAAAVGLTAGVGGVGTAAAAPGFDGWLSNTSNYDGLVDERGSDEVVVDVGVQGNNGTNGFGPAAVRVDPGTTVVWEWTGDGYHNVVEQDGAFESESTAEAGFNFEQTFEEEGVVKYYCSPHEMLGMKGVVVVGDQEFEDAGGSGGGGGGPDYGDWFDGVSNFEETADMTGQDSVTVEVGVEGNNGTFAFGPPAIRVDPGTTVTWEWTGQGGSHDVVAEDGGFSSDLVGEAGHTFEHTFESGGVHTYYCTPHREMGMRGAVVVPGGSGGGGDGGIDASKWLSVGGAVALVGGLFGLIGLGTHEHRNGRT